MYKLTIKESEVHGKGCYATKHIETGERIGEYVGELISADEADERFEEYKSESTYLFSLTNDEVIDATPIEHPVKYINHSCNPNAESEELEGRIYIVAIKDIQEGEEITYEYELTSDDDEHCLCRSPNCKGTMKKV